MVLLRFARIYYKSRFSPIKIQNMSLKIVSLFAGIGGLHVPDSIPLLYCDIDKHSRRVLKARMKDGFLAKAPIHEDVCTLERLPANCQMLVAGFPCQNISSAGNKDGLDGKQSGLFWEVARLAKVSRPQYLFLENVKNIRFLPCWKIILHTLHQIGFDCRWVQTSAEMCGAFHERMRWFCLCELVREANQETLQFDAVHMYANGQLVDGVYSETCAVVGHPVPLDLTLVHSTGPRPCASTDIVTHPVKRVRFATPRHSGGSYPALGLTERCSYDLSTQLRFEIATPLSIRWVKHCRPNADWVDIMMGFPKGYTDFSKVLKPESKDASHSFVEDMSVPRLIGTGGIPNSIRLRLLGNACVPQQSELSFNELWTRMKIHQESENTFHKRRKIQSNSGKRMKTR